MKIRRTVSAKHWPRNAHLAKLYRDFPALRIALAEAKHRFSEFPGVRGFGIGKKLKGKRGTVVRLKGCSGGLSVHVFVEGKKSIRELSLSLKTTGVDYKLPRSLLVKIPGRKYACRVPLDVISAGDLVRPLGVIAQSGGPPRSLTHVGSTNLGRVFGLAPKPGGVPGIEAGTVGAIVRDQNAQAFAITAGHVVVDIERPPWIVPQQPIRIYLANNQVVQVPPTAFYPQRLGLPPNLVDTILFRTSPKLAPDLFNCSWPTVFDGNLATTDDTALAFGEDREGSFIWVQREITVDPGRQVSREPWALEVNIIGNGPYKRVSSTGNAITYPDLWWYRYPRYSGNPNDPWQITIPGDSGSGLYVRSAENPNQWRLLGFHIYCLSDGRGNWWGLAVPAQQFLEMLVGQHQDKWWFYGKE